MRGLVLFAHGARDPEWAAPFEAIRARVRTRRPEFPVALAFLEFMKPSLAEAVDRVVAEGATSVIVYPLFMAQGGHLKHDLPGILDRIRASHPHVPIALEAAVGDVPELLDAIAGWILARAD